MIAIITIVTAIATTITVVVVIIKCPFNDFPNSFLIVWKVSNHEHRFQQASTTANLLVLQNSVQLLQIKTEKLHFSRF